MSRNTNRSNASNEINVNRGRLHLHALSAYPPLLLWRFSNFTLKTFQLGWGMTMSIFKVTVIRETEHSAPFFHILRLF